MDQTNAHPVRALLEEVQEEACTTAHVRARHKQMSPTPVTAEEEKPFSKIFIHIAHVHTYAFVSNYKSLVRAI